MICLLIDNKTATQYTSLSFTRFFKHSWKRNHKLHATFLWSGL